MNDLHDDLVRAGNAAPPSMLDLERLHARRDRTHTRRRVAATVVALSICVAVVGGAVSVLAHRETGHGVGIAPAEGGSTFGPPTDVTLADGQYAYTRRVNYTYFKHSVDRYPSATWWATDDSGRMEPWGDPATDGEFAAGGFPTDEYRSYFGSLSGLSTDPATLEQQLIDRIESGGVRGAAPLPTPAPGREYPLAERLIMAISGLQGASDVPPELKAALFRVLADQPGINVVRDGTDPVGRSAIELWWRAEYEFPQIHRIWFDAQTEQPMAWEDANDLPDDSRTYFRTIVERAGVVNATSSTDLLISFFPSTDEAPGG